MASLQFDPKSVGKNAIKEAVRIAPVTVFFTSLVEGGTTKGVSFPDTVTEALRRVAEVYGIGVCIDTFPIVVKNAGPGAIIQVPKGYLKKDRPDIIDDSHGSPTIGEINKLGNADRCCSNCGKRYDDTDSFCTKCGNERKWS